MPWDGLACNDGGQVVGLDLAYRNLDGTLPTQIGDLTTLTTGRNSADDSNRFLKDNSLTGTLPTEIGRLSQFQHAM